MDRLSRPPGPWRVAKGHLLGLPGACLLVVLLLGVNLLQVLSLLVLPFSGRGFTNMNRGVAAGWWGVCVLLGKALHGARVTGTGDAVPRGENAILLPNHQEMTDVVFVSFLAWEAGRLGDMKWFVKDPVKYVPGLGWGMWFLDNIFVKRSWTLDRRSVEAAFDRLRRHRAPFWLVIFAEGTRRTEDKQEKALALAGKRGRALLENVLPPHTRGFTTSVAGLRGRLDAVYDITIAYPRGVPSLWQYIVGYADEAHVHLRRFAAASLPAQPGELAAWLEERFARKDARLARFRRTGSLGGEAPPPV